MISYLYRGQCQSVIAVNGAFDAACPCEGVFGTQENCTDGQQVFCNLFFLSRVLSGTLALYIFILQHISVAAAVASGVLLLRDARRLARTFDAQLADLRLLMILTLGFQTILPAQIALMSARGVNTPLGWYIVIAQMAGVLLAFMLVGGLVAALRSLLGEERCRAWRGDMALFNGIVTLCVTGFLLYHMVSAYPRIFAALH